MGFFHILAVGVPLLLSQTGLYTNISKKTVSPSNRLYVPQYPLWTDGASKQRWISLPEGTEIDSTQGDAWVFPVGTKIWKEFTFNLDGKTKRIETRLMEKMPDEEWQFATYLWNETETEATLAPEDGIKNYLKTSEKTYHDIPSTTDCLRCHRHLGDPVLGFDALQLSIDRDPLALHTEALPENSLTLKTLIDKKKLSVIAPEIQNGVQRIQTQNPLGRAAMGYFHSNCASCHNPMGSSMHIRLNFRHSIHATTELEEDSFKSSVERLAQIFAIPNQDKTYLIKKGNPDLSAVVYTMEHREVSHMPPIGANIVDKKAVELIRKWISELN